MAKKTIDVQPVTPTTLVKEKREGMALITPLTQETDLLEVITSPGELAVADELFGRIQRARRTWKLKMYGTPAKPGPIPAIRSGLDQLYDLNREVDRPLEMLESRVENRMKAYHLKLLREKQAEDEAKRLREQAAADALAELERKKALLKTPQAKAKVEAEIVEAAAELEELQQEEEAEPLELDHSRPAPKKVLTVGSLSDVCQGIVDGVIPEDLVSVNMVKLRAYHKDDPTAIALWATYGITLEDDINIVGR